MQSCLLGAIEGFGLSADVAPLFWPPTNKWKLVLNRSNFYIGTSKGRYIITFERLKQKTSVNPFLYSAIFAITYRSYLA